ncbi:hypothetical protein TIFTF001_031310 [Ficus carica]|uniref:Cytochrome P450 n=1 Tax=Ficus carica TaxID=3494 RepID=A0AA88J0T6_FICCA|nr:hypothetical protein TIFTF001_031310 [Ficus carica]
MHLKLGEVSHIVVSSPEVAKEMLRTHDVNFSQRPLLLGGSKYNSLDIVFSPYGDYWRELRRICTQELLSPKRVQSFRSIREEEVSNLIGDIRSNKGLVVNLSEKIFSLTYCIIARAAFGKKCKEQEEFTALVKEALAIAGGFSVCDVFPSQTWLHWISGMGFKLEENYKKTNRILDNIIDEHKADKARRTTCEKDVAESLLDVLSNLQGNNSDGFSLETRNIKAIILDIFIAGGDSSSAVIEWAILEMLKNPRVMEKAQKEVRQVFGQKGNVDETGLHELKYLHFVIKETLRLRAPGPLLPRESRENCVINGYQIPAKTKFIVNTWAMARDPEYWTEPERFYPERFIESSVDFKGTDFQFIPFGAGRRMCAGMSFGLADVKLPLAQLLFHFDWKLPDGINHENLDMSESFGLSLRRKGDLYLIPIPYNHI